MKFGSSQEFLRGLKENTLDIAFFLDKKIEQEDFITAIQFPEPMVLLASPEHPLALRDNVMPEDLDDEAMILTEPGCGYRTLFENLMTLCSVKPRSIIETGNVHTIKQLTMSGMGITLLPLVAVEEECNQQRLVQLDWKGPDFTILTQVLYHKNKWISASLQAFIELLHETRL